MSVTRARLKDGQVSEHARLDPPVAAPLVRRPVERHRHPGGRGGDESTPGALTGCRLIDLPRVTDPRGNLTFLESEQTIPFAIERVYYLYDVPGGESRGGHA